MFLEGVIIYWPAIWAIIGLMFCSAILGLILNLHRVKNLKRSLVYVQEKQYRKAIELLNKNLKTRFISLEERSVNDLYLALIGLLTSDDELFLNHISQVTFRKHLMIRSFWESIYYLEKEDMEKYAKSMEAITKHYQSNYKSKYDTQEALDRYLLILKTLEKENQEEEIRRIYQQVPEAKVFIKEYLAKYLQ